MQLPYGLLWSLIFFLFNHQFLFWDEELLVALGLLGLYAFLFFSSRRLLRFTLFHRAEGVYFYFYFLLELLGVLSAQVGALLQALLAQWEAFYGLQLSLFLVHRLDTYVAQGQRLLEKNFFFSSFALNFVCYSLCSLLFTVAPELLLDSSAAASLGGADAGESSSDLGEPTSSEGAPGEGAAFSSQEPGPWEALEGDPVPEVFVYLALRSLLV